MAIALVSATDAPVSTGITDTTTARQRRIIDAGNPSVWLTPESKYFAADGSGKVAIWQDALNPGRFIPSGATPPTVNTEAAGLRSITLPGVSGQALVDNKGRDLLPASGSPASLVILTKQPLATFGNTLIGSLVPTATGAMIAFIDATTGKPTFAPRFAAAGNPFITGAANLADNAWHVLVLSYPGATAGGQWRVDGANNGSASAAAMTLAAHADARKLAIGGCGPGGNSVLGRGKIAGVMVLPVDLGAVANADLLADVEAEFAAWKALLP